MQKKNITFLLVIIVLFGTCCNGKKDKNYHGSNTNVLQQIQQTEVNNDIKKDSCNYNTIKSFFKWYKDHFNYIQSIQLVDLVEDSSTAQYRVDFKNVNKYIHALRSSGYFSEDFLQNKLKYFQDADMELVKKKQNDGPPLGFESDLLLFTQEPEMLLEQLKSFKLEEVKPNVIKLKLTDNDLLFDMEVQKGQIMIQRIVFSKK